MTRATTLNLSRNHRLDAGLRAHRLSRWLLLVLALFAVDPAYAQQPLFTFVQISDSQPTDSDDQLAFEEVLDTIADAGTPGALLPYPVDYVVFAGDLVNIGNDTSDWTTFVQTMNLWLTANGIPYRAVPGNHDRSSNFGNYAQFIGSPATWSMGSDTFVGHNGRQVTTGWRGLRYIGINNTNGGNNVISAADLAAVNIFVPAAVAADENIFLMAHHPHDDQGLMPLAGILETPEICGYMRGHNGNPTIRHGLAGVSNPNVWELMSNAVYRDRALLYFEVFQNDIEAHVIKLVDNPSQLPAPRIIPLVHSLIPAGGGPPTTLPAGSTTTLPEGTTTTTTLPPSGAIVLAQVRTGTSASSNFVSTSSPLTAVSGDLYLAAVSTKSHTPVIGVSGLGLPWSAVLTQCSGRNQTGVSIWMAQGTPTLSGTVTASLAATVSVAAIAVSRYSGAGVPVAFDDLDSANTNGVDGACTGGSDSAAYSFGVTSVASNSLVYAAVGMRNRQLSPGAGYTQQASAIAGSGGQAANLAVVDRTVALPSAITVNGSFDGSVDWSVAAVVIPGADDPGLCSGDPDCDDGNVCTDDHCDGSGACVSTNRAAGTACTSDGNSCTNDQCDGAGTCAHFSNAAPCGDGFFCNGTDTCAAGSCSVHAGDPCTNGPQCARTCNEVGDSCNASAGTVCDDGNQCTDDQCNGAGACVSVAKATGTPCPDGNLCNGGELCDAGSCDSGTSLNCSDSDPCTADSCVPATGCRHTDTCGSGEIVFEEVRTGGSSASTTVATSAPLSAASDHLYLASIATKGRVDVLAVSGLGLTWTLVAKQCAGRNQTGAELWMARGVAGAAGIVTATLSVAPTNAVIAVSRYSSVALGDPIGTVTSANTNGIGAGCSGGTDSSSYALSLATTAPGSVVHVSASMRNRNHTPAVGYLERSEVKQGTSGSTMASVAQADRTIPSPASVAVAGTFDGSVDWAVVGAEILAGAPGPPPTSTTTTTNTTSTTQVPATTTTMMLSGTVSLEEVATGTSAAVATVATSVPLSAVAGQLYLAAVSAKSNVAVTGVSGLGLVWTQRATQCSGRNQTGVSVWSAKGVPSGDSAVTATFAGAPSNAAIAVARYGGVGVAPIGSIGSANSNGVGGTCSGGSDSAAYAFDLVTTVPGAVVFVAPAMRGASHTPGAGYLEQVEVHAGSGGSGASTAVVDRTVAAPGGVSINGSFSSSVDWAVVALEVRP